MTLIFFFWECIEGYVAASGGERGGGEKMILER